jgi:hypothetical protein
MSSGTLYVIRPLAVGAATLAAFLVVGGPGAGFGTAATQAALAAGCVLAADAATASMDNGSLAGPLVSGALFAGVNRFALGQPAGLADLFVLGAGIDVAATFIGDPVSRFLNL